MCRFYGYFKRLYLKNGADLANLGTRNKLVKQWRIDWCNKICIFVRSCQNDEQVKPQSRSTVDDAVAQWQSF